jgi:aspartate/methionine/tyrosine aminotransferase
LTALADEQNFHILVDEVYGEWLREDAVPSTAHASSRVIATSSLTKVWGLGGLRIGWILAQPALAERMRRLAGLFDNVIAHPSERLAVRALARSAAIIGQHAALLARNRQILRQWVATTSDGRWVEPAAGAIGFVDLGIGDVWDFVERLALERGTLIVPGHFFGAPDHVRIGLGTDSAILEQGLSGMTEQMKGHTRQDPRRPDS